MINSGDTAWVLISTALVILMTPALGFFYAGMVRKKNILSTLMLSVVMLALITVQWMLYGYSLSFGTDHAGIIGGLNWLGLNGVGATVHEGYAPTIPHLLFMFFQLAFAVITPALITGAFVERIKFPSFLLFSLLWATFIYAPVAHWVWGIGGWLRAMGALDFAGGIVVHITAGISALAVALVIGKRKGYGKTPMEPSNIPLTVLGAFLCGLDGLDLTEDLLYLLARLLFPQLLQQTLQGHRPLLPGCYLTGCINDRAFWAFQREPLLVWRQ